VLLTTGWLGHTASYVEQLSQLLLVGVSGYAFTRRRSKRTPAFLLLAWTGAVGLSLVMVPIYGEAFVAP